MAFYGQWSQINYSGGGTGLILTCPTGCAIRVTAYRLSATAANTAAWAYGTSSGSTTVIDGPHFLPAGGPPMVVGANPEEPVFQLPPNENLYLTTTAASQVSGGISASIVPAPS